MNEQHPVIVGLDKSSGSDRTVIAVRRGREVLFVGEVTRDKCSGMRSVYVVETLIPHLPLWWPMSAHVARRAAWERAREYRLKWPTKQFRTTAYRSSK